MDWRTVHSGKYCPKLFRTSMQMMWCSDLLGLSEIWSLQSTKDCKEVLLAVSSCCSESCLIKVTSTLHEQQSQRTIQIIIDVLLNPQWSLFNPSFTNDKHAFTVINSTSGPTLVMIAKHCSSPTINDHWPTLKYHSEHTIDPNPGLINYRYLGNTPW